jgi:hypothetical protein
MPTYQGVPQMTTVEQLFKGAASLITGIGIAPDDTEEIRLKI